MGKSNSRSLNKTLDDPIDIRYILPTKQMFVCSSTQEAPAGEGRYEPSPAGAFFHCMDRQTGKDGFN
ncbi:hypothetical protein GCM10010916_23610 [Paenibacillus abyssi]|uniref:Uncharacterized protein n=1 Tax=Paenibacillus abyssi TaxID=1340531 RepID=A0A917D140_9BACL|nr:hypothetical protein GCM10010916_23610 [Paenibacillus abyssi]